MNFYQKYELLELLNDDGIKSFRARNIATGGEVLAHLFVAPESRAVFEKISQFGPESRRAILEIGDNEGTPYVVTASAPGLAALRNWVNAQAVKPPVKEMDPFSRAGKWKVPDLGPRPAAPAAKPPVLDASGFKPAFSRPAGPPPPAESLFGTPAVEQEVTRTIPAPAAPAAAPPPPTPEQPSAPAREPGAFTKLFRASTPVETPPAYAEPPAAPPPPGVEQPPAPPTPEPGAFTKLFRASTPVEAPPAYAGPPSAPPPAPKVEQPPQPPLPGRSTPLAPEPGQFTRMFQAQPAAPAPAMPSQPGAPGPGEFTKLFQAPLGSGTAPVTPSQPSGPAPGEFTKLFQSPLGSEPGPAPAAPSPPGAAPGEFTKLFQAPMGGPPQPQGPSEFDNLFQGPPRPAATGGQPSRHPQDPGAFTRMFGPSGPHQAASQPPSAAPSRGGGATQIFGVPSAAPPPPAAIPSRGPGEYTKLFASPVAPPTAAAPASPVAAAPIPGAAAPVSPSAFNQAGQQPAPPKRSYLPLILGLNALLLIVLAAIVYLLLRQR